MSSYNLVVLGTFITSLVSLCVPVLLPMAGPDDDASGSHSPRTAGIIQHFERQVKLHTEGLDTDLQVTNDKIGQLEDSQITTNTKLVGLETSMARIDTTLAALLRRFDEFNTRNNERRPEPNQDDEE